MRVCETLAGVLGISGFIYTAGAFGACELGGPISTFLWQSILGLAMMFISICWLEFLQYLQEERYANSLKYKSILEVEE